MPSAIKKRFSIWVLEHGSDREIELCQVESNPEPTVTALYAKRIRIGKAKVPQYNFVRIVENACSET